jgi:hypothetical protein
MLIRIEVFSSLKVNLVILRSVGITVQKKKKKKKVESVERIPTDFELPARQEVDFSFCFLFVAGKHFVDFNHIF